MSDEKKPEWRGPEAQAAWFDEIANVWEPSERTKALIAQHVEHYELEGETFLSVDISLNAPPVAVVGKKLPDGGFTVEVEHEAEGIHALVQDAVKREMARRVKRNDDFLRDLLRVTDYEYSVIRSLQYLTGHMAFVGGRGHGKKLRAEVAEKIIKRMDAPLPANFWDTVEAHNMLEDKEGRDLVQAIIDRKLGCNVERTSD